MNTQSSGESRSERHYIRQQRAHPNQHRNRENDRNNNYKKFHFNRNNFKNKSHAQNGRTRFAFNRNGLNKFQKDFDLRSKCNHGRLPNCDGKQQFSNFESSTKSCSGFHEYPSPNFNMNYAYQCQPHIAGMQFQPPPQLHQYQQYPYLVMQANASCPMHTLQGMVSNMNFHNQNQSHLADIYGSNMNDALKACTKLLHLQNLSQNFRIADNVEEL